MAVALGCPEGRSLQMLAVSLAGKDLDNEIQAEAKTSLPLVAGGNSCRKARHAVHIVERDLNVVATAVVGNWAEDIG